jgi:hypothetical protein
MRKSVVLPLELTFELPPPLLPVPGVSLVMTGAGLGVRTTLLTTRGVLGSVRGTTRIAPLERVRGTGGSHTREVPLRRTRGCSGVTDVGVAWSFSLDCPLCATAELLIPGTKLQGPAANVKASIKSRCVRVMT